MIYKTKQERAEEARRIFSNAEFKEEDHPRGEDGKFGKGGGGGKKETKAKKKEPENKKSDPAKEAQDVIDKYKGTDKWMKSPNGKPTKLNEKQWVQVRTPSFQNWFGDWENDPENASKAVDENGEPMIVYHGTSESFSEFNPDNIGENYRDSSGGFFFTDKKQSAANYAKLHTQRKGEEGDGFVMTSFLNIRNNYWDQAEDYWGAVEKFDRNSHNITRNAKIEKKDGVIIGSPKGSLFVAFNPNQIKSATDNKGEFDPKSNKFMNSTTIRIYRARK